MSPTKTIEVETTTIEPVVVEDAVDHITYEGSHFPWWMLIIWVGFITFFTYYTVVYMVPNLDTWVKKPPYSRFEP